MNLCFRVLPHHTNYRCPDTSPVFSLSNRLRSMRPSIALLLCSIASVGISITCPNVPTADFIQIEKYFGRWCVRREFTRTEHLTPQFLRVIRAFMRILGILVGERDIKLIVRKPWGSIAPVRPAVLPVSMTITSASYYYVAYCSLFVTIV